MDLKGEMVEFDQTSRIAEDLGSVSAIASLSLSVQLTQFAWYAHGEGMMCHVAWALTQASRLEPKV